MTLYYSLTPSKNIRLFSTNVLLSSTKLDDDIKEMYDLKKEKEEIEFEDEYSYKEYLDIEITKNEKIYFTCVDRKSKKKIGFISFKEIDNSNKCLKVENIIGFNKEKKEDHDLIFESFFILFDYLFEHCQFERIEFKQKEEQDKGNLFEELKFKMEGNLKIFDLEKKKFKNLKLYSLLMSEWNFEKENLKKLKCKL
eukprot:gene3477-6126_t